MSAFFLAVSQGVFGDCGTNIPRQPLTVGYVYDGDTLKSSDRKKIRLVGINTPELSDNRKHWHAIAEDGRDFVVRWVDEQESLYFQAAKQKYDKYGRSLGYVINNKGEDLGLALIAQGYAFYVAFGVNDSKLSCYQIAENQARNQRKGLWRMTPVIAADSLKQSGFSIIEGRVTRVFHFKTSLGFVLDEQLVVMLKSSSRPFVKVGEYFQVRGWVLNKPFRYKDFSASYLLPMDNNANINRLEK